MCCSNRPSVAPVMPELFGMSAHENQPGLLPQAAKAVARPVTFVAATATAMETVDPGTVFF
jgi:hypothetical protein